MAEKNKDPHAGEKGIKVVFPKGYKNEYFHLIKEVTGMSGTGFIKQSLMEFINEYRAVSVNGGDIDYILTDGIVIETVKGEQVKSRQQDRLSAYMQRVANLKKKESREEFIKNAINNKAYQNKTIAEIKKEYRYSQTAIRNKESYDISKIWLSVDENILLEETCKKLEVTKSALAIYATKRRLRNCYNVVHDEERFPF